MAKDKQPNTEKPNGDESTITLGGVSFTVDEIEQVTINRNGDRVTIQVKQDEPKAVSKPLGFINHRENGI